MRRPTFDGIISSCAWQSENLVVDRGARRIVDGLSFTVEAGEALVLVGPNGAGKTTVIRAVAGLIGAAGGTIALESGDAERELPAAGALHRTSQCAEAVADGGRELRFWAEYLGAGTQASIDEALVAFDLEPLAAIPAGYLSAGQKRRAVVWRG